MMFAINAPIIKKRGVSWSVRLTLIALLGILCLIAITIHLPVTQKKVVDRFFLDSDYSNSLDEALIIDTNGQQITVFGQEKQIYQPLLSDTLGTYQSHRYLGWHADYRQWRKGVNLPFSLLYEVNYSHGVVREYFYFKGGFTPRLWAREVNLDKSTEI